MQFTFNSKFVGFGSPSTTLEFEADTLQDVLEKFADFLRGSGYHFDGYLDVVPYDEDIPEMPEYEFDEETTASPEWQAVVNSLMNPPKFRANQEKDVYGGACPECGISKVEMRGHKCWDKRCPLPESAVNAN